MLYIKSINKGYRILELVTQNNFITWPEFFSELKQAQRFLNSLGYEKLSPHAFVKPKENQECATIAKH